MKRISTIAIATLLFFVMACSNDKAPSNPPPQQVIPPTSQPAPPINTNTVDNSAAANATNAAGEYHYVCPNGDPGGAGSAGLCPTCNAQLVHNQAFHNTEQSQSPITTTTTPAPNANAAQNAAGEWHYACPNGHAGAGAAGSCATCGAQLAHNQAFHTDNTASPTITTPPATTPGQPISPLIQTPQSNTPTINVPSTPGTATNSRGEYHYTCPNGHAGSGSAGTCATCSAQLVHNQAYHN